MSRVVVVTGTDTGVGKTVVTAALAVRARATGTVQVVKPVQTGVALNWQSPTPRCPSDRSEPGEDQADESRADIDDIHRLSGCAGQEYTCLADPLAPDTAARLRGVRIPPVVEYADRVRVLAEFEATVLVEGAGGALVRLDTQGGTILHLAAELQAELVVVTRPGLGTLNHTELTVAACRAHGIEPVGLVIGCWPDRPGLAEQCNRDDLPRVTGVPLIGVVPAGAGALTREEFVSRSPTWLR